MKSLFVSLSAAFLALPALASSDVSTVRVYHCSSSERHEDIRTIHESSIHVTVLDGSIQRVEGRSVREVRQLLLDGEKVIESVQKRLSGNVIKVTLDGARYQLELSDDSTADIGSVSSRSGETMKARVLLLVDYAETDARVFGHGPLEVIGFDGKNCKIESRNVFAK